MTDTVETTQASTDYLAMSDAEMLNAGPPVEQAAEEKIVETSVSEEFADDAADSEKGEDAGTQSADESTDEPEQRAQLTQDEGPADAKDTEVKQELTKVVDYEAEYKRLLAPFKANGREIAVNSVEDAVSLMQMGANYNKKMAALKPNLKLMKLLENNGLLSEEKISFLIDLEKKNPDAINKLVKDSGIDPMDIDASKASEYSPKIHSVDDREMELDTVLDEIQDTPTYSQTLEIVSKKWDGASKQTVASTPQLLKVINDHVASGIYSMITEEVERERVFGRLTGLSDIEAYRQVGDAIQARGGFNHIGNQVRTPVVVQPKPKKADDDKLNEKRRAASATKSANLGTSNQSEFNPLAMSDAEFAKMADSRFR